MSKHTELEQQLSAALRTRAESASLSNDAWNSIVAQLSGEGGRVDDAGHAVADLVGKSMEVSFDEHRWRRWPYVAIGAAAAVLVLIAVLLAGPADQGTIDSVNNSVNTPDTPTSFAPTLTQDIPAELDSGTITTPEGVARWVHLSGDSNSVPSGDAIPWPTGFAMFERGAARLWLSPDGINWQVDDSLPIPPRTAGARLSFDRGVYWLVTSTSPDGLWRSTDGSTWEAFDTSGVISPGPAGMGPWSDTFSSPITVGDLTFSLASFRAEFPFADYVADYVPAPFDEPCVEGFRELTPGVFEIVPVLGASFYSCTRGLPVLRFEETETGLDVFDNATGVEVGQIAGADLGDMAEIEAGDLNEYRLLVIGDDEIVQLEVPWSAPATLFGTESWIYAYVESGSGLLTVWRSSDGISWSNLGPLSFVSEGSSLSPNLSSVPGGPLVAMATQERAAWETTDGVTWVSAPGELPDAPPPGVGYPGGTTPIRLASGWFANDGSQGGPTDGDGWWMYVGGEWLSLEEIGVEGSPSVGGGGVRSTAIGEITIFYTSGQYLFGRSRNVWILSNEPA
jgi:hypothetical protein